MGITVPYSRSLDSLLGETEAAPLGPGRPLPLPLPDLQLETLYDSALIVNVNYAHCVLAGLWLRLGYLEKSHDIVNGISSPDGSYWHALMHRREPDISNSDYWFRRVGVHPVFSHLLKRAGGLEGGENNQQLNQLLISGRWNPQQFNELCESSRDSGTDLEKLCIKIQELEWHLLFEYCYVSSLGKNWQSALLPS